MNEASRQATCQAMTFDRTSLRRVRKAAQKSNGAEVKGSDKVGVSLCSTVTDCPATSISLVDRVTLPDASFYQSTYEATAGMSGDVTGRVASVTLPTGGTISYSYYGGTNGIACNDGSTPGMNRVTTDGTRQYQRAGVSGNANAFTTMFQDEKNNQTEYHFSVETNANFEATHKQVYKGTTSSGTLLQEVLTCYNGSSGSCDGQAITAPVTEADVTSSFNGGSQLLTKNTMDSTGAVLTKQAQYNGSTLMKSVTNSYNLRVVLLSARRLPTTRPQGRSELLPG